MFISKQNIEGLSWFLLIILKNYEKREIVEGNVKQNQTITWTFGNFQSIHIARNENICSGKKNKSMAGEKIIWWRDYRCDSCVNQASWQKIGIKVGLYQQKPCQPEFQRTEMLQNVEWLSDFCDSTVGSSRVVQPQNAILKKKKKKKERKKEEELPQIWDYLL